MKVRNVTDAGEVHAAVNKGGHIATACGIEPLPKTDWKFTFDKVTCDACKEEPK